MSIIDKIINLGFGLTKNTKIAYYTEMHGYYFVILDMKNSEKANSFMFSLRFRDSATAQNFVRQYVVNKSEFDIHIEDNVVLIEPRYNFSQLRIDCVNEEMAKKLVKHFRKQYAQYEKKKTVGV